MGPRLFSRGNPQGPLGRTTGRRAFNGAATLQSRKYGGGRHREKLWPPLQWGRDSSVAEMPVIRNSGSAFVPSMGPRLFSRGNG